MAVTFGFYNSRNGDRVYNAQQMSSIFSGIIRDGVFEHFPAENQHLHVDWLDGHVGENVVIGPGRAWLNNTWTDNDSNLVMQLATPNPNPNIERIDAIVLEINKTNNSDFTANMSEAVPGRSNKFIVLKGTEASPSDIVKPALRNGNGIYQHYIALVRVSANSEHHYITNMVGAGDGTPFIIGAVQNVSTASVLQAWTQAFNAEIERLAGLVPGQLDDICEAYFDNPDSEVYHQIDEFEQEVNEQLRALDPNVTYLTKRRHVWLIDCPVSKIPDYAETYTKQPPQGTIIAGNYEPVANPPHNIYPDFYNTIPIVNGLPAAGGTKQITSPNVGDVVIGSNGYYAVITHWQLSGDDYSATYSMIIKSTGKSVVEYPPEEFVMTFSGGRDMNGDDISSTAPASCNRSFGEIRNALISGQKLVAKMGHTEQYHGDGGDYDVDWVLEGPVEKYFSDGVLMRITARFMHNDEQEGHMLIHEYAVTPYDVTCRCIWL